MASHTSVMSFRGRTVDTEPVAPRNTGQRWIQTLQMIAAAQSTAIFLSTHLHMLLFTTATKTLSVCPHVQSNVDRKTFKVQFLVNEDSNSASEVFLTYGC